MAILHEDRVTGMRDGRREFDQQIEIRCWDSLDARTAVPTRLPFERLTADTCTAWLDTRAPFGIQKTINGRFHPSADMCFRYSLVGVKGLRGFRIPLEAKSLISCPH